MKKLKRKGQNIFAMLMALVLTASCLTYATGTTAEAAAPESDFLFEDGTITEYIGADTNVVIPSTIGGETVTKIGMCAFMMSNAETVVVPATVEELEFHAFFYCFDLSEVTFEGKISTYEDEPIGCCADDIVIKCQEQYKAYYEEFSRKVDAITCTVDASLPNVGGTTEPTVPVEPSKPVGDAKEIFGLVEVEGGYKVTAYDVEKGGKNVVVPAEYDGKAIVEIGEAAFSLSKANVGIQNWITSITLPDTIKVIGENAFYGCSKVTAIVLPEGLETIGEAAFRYCNGLKEINIPASVTAIGERAFKQSRAAYLEAINVAEENANYMSVDGVLFTKDEKTLICYPTGKVGAPYTMPDTVEAIANDAFKGDASIYDDSVANGNKQHKLTGIVFSKNLKTIGERAFEQTSLNSVTITSSLEVGKYAFAGCDKLETVIIGEGVTEIPECMFMGMENCKTVKLPSTLKKIGYRAFDRYGADTIELPEGLEVIGEEAFANSAFTQVTIPSTVTTLGARAFYSSDKLVSVDFAKNAKLESIGEFAFNWCTALESVTLPTSLKKLESGCFSYCFALTGIQIPNGVKELGDCVFSGSRLAQIVLPDSIEKMGSATFRNCVFVDEAGNITGLESVTMPKNLKELGTCTFEKCEALKKVTFPEDIKLTYIPEDTFYQCTAIEYIYLPAAIAETRACAFSNCDKNPKIEYANKNLQRNIFDCYPIDPGTAYELAEDGFYYTTEELSDSDYSNGLLNEAGKKEEAQAYVGQLSTIHGRSAGSTLATCGCGAYGASVKLTPSSNPTFVYKKPAASGENAGNGQNNNTGNNAGNNNNGSTNNDKTTSPSVTGSVVKTGDEAVFTGYVVMLLAAMAAVVAVVASRRRTVGQR